MSNEQREVKTEYRKPSELKPYGGNPRKNEDAIIRVAESIQAFGFNQPVVVDENDEIIVGETRWKAGIRLNLTRIPTWKLTDLSEAEKRQYRIRDNRTHEFSDWDYGRLLDELEDLKDMGEDIALTGFTEDDFEFMAGADEPESHSTSTDEPTMLQCPHCGEEFEESEAIRS